MGLQMLKVDSCLGEPTGLPVVAGDLDRLFASIAHLETFYPQFGRWFWRKVVPGLGNGSRRILPVHTGETLVGITILKRIPEERKICTLWVAPFARQIGVGRRLLSDSLAWLDCDKPLITVCQERLNELQPLLRKFGFSLEQVCDSYYRPGRLEYVFNGLTAQPKDKFQCFNLSALDFEERAFPALGLPPRCNDFKIL
jgi:hypothetical protein